MKKGKKLVCSKAFDPVSKTVLTDVCILIQGEKIEGLVPRDGQNGDWEGYDEIDLTHLFVTPGLIDTHVHLGLSGQPDPGATRPRETIGDWTLTGLKNAQKDLLAGFTSLRVCGDRSFISEAIRDAINRGDHYGPRLMTCGQYIGTTGSHADDGYSPYLSDPGLREFIVDGADGVRRAARYNIKHGCNFIKFMSTGGIMSPGTTVGMQQMTFEEMKAACDTAAMYGMTSATHAHGTAAIKDAVRAGVTSVEHGTMMDDEAVELMLKQGTVLVPTLVAIDRIISHGAGSGIPSWAIEKARTVKAAHQRSLAACMEAGVPIAFGTDTGTPFSLHGEQSREFELLTECGMRPEDALVCATLGAARLMRWEDRVGSIEAGKMADIVAFHGNPLVDSKQYASCAFVMKGGTIVKNE